MTGVQTCALPIWGREGQRGAERERGREGQTKIEKELERVPKLTRRAA